MNSMSRATYLLSQRIATPLPSDKIRERFEVRISDLTRSLILLAFFVFEERVRERERGRERRREGEKGRESVRER